MIRASRHSIPAPAAARPARRGSVHERGAAILELSMLVPLLLVLLLATVDMGRLVYMNQLSTDLTRTAASMGARGFTAAEAIAAIHNTDTNLNVENIGLIFVSTIERKAFNDPTPWVVSQTQNGDLPGFVSKVGTSNGAADLPEITSLEPGMSLTAVEVAVPFTPLFPFDGLGLNFYPPVVYEVAYF